MQRHNMFLVMAVLLAGCSGPRLASIPPAADGQHYYSFEAGYRCRSFAPNPAGVPSWVEHLEVRGAQILRWGTRCQDSAVPLGARERARLRFGSDGRSLDLDGRHFITVADPVAEAARLAG